MTERQLKYRVTWLYLSLQAGIIIYTLFFVMATWISWDLAKNVIARVFPVFTGYTTAMLAFISQDRHRTIDDSPAITATFSVITVSLPLLYTLVVAVLIYLQGFHLRALFSTPGDFLDALTMSQAIFAAYIGKMMSGLFQTVGATTHPGATPRTRRTRAANSSGNREGS
jgi:hypothetical protein